MRSEEFSAKTKEEAIALGLEAMGASVADVDIEVVEEGSKGFLGILGSKPAVVRLTLREDEDVMKDVLSSVGLDDVLKEPEKKPARRRADKGEKAEKPAKADKDEKAEKPAKADKDEKAEKPAKADKDEKAEKPAKADKGEKAEKPAKADKGEKAEKPAKPAKADKGEKAEKPAKADKGEKAEKPAKADKLENAEQPAKPQQPAEPQEPAPMCDPATPEGKAQRFLLDVTERMGVNVSVHARRDEEGNVRVDMYGDTLGILIGRRGETLDALQYLTSLHVNKGQESYTRVTLDTENYRAKREEALRRLANRMANRAVKTGRKVVMEPMNPYERRILHSALQQNEAVTTHSEGEEPNRHVVITLKQQD